jgi:hypothetical protein
MDNMVIKEQALERIKKIHSASLEYNKKEGKEHNKRLLDLIRHHVDEIEELFAAGDRHSLVETGDLAVLCFELLIENGVSIDDILLKCFDRYDNKLASLLNEAGK